MSIEVFVFAKKGQKNIGPYYSFFFVNFYFILFFYSYFVDCVMFLHVPIFLHRKQRIYV